MSYSIKGANSVSTLNVMELYEKLNIDVKKMPPYQGAEQFAQQFKRCSITKDVFVSSSDASTASIQFDS